MVSEVRHGASQRSVAQKYGCSLSSVQYWIKRSEGCRLDRVDWGDRPRIPRKTQRTSSTIENMILTVRQELRKNSDLGEYGAEAIYRELINSDITEVPCIRTIGRIFERRGALDGRIRVRRPAPPRGWYLPDVARGIAELDSFDVVEGLVIRGGTHVDVLNGISLHGTLPVSWPMEMVSAKGSVMSLIEHWQQVGLPIYAQFDNDTRFQGAHHHRDSISRVMRLCVSLGVTPVFVPPRERGFQASIENYNGRWQTKVWSRFQHANIEELVARSDRYVAAYRKRVKQKIEAAPPRRPFPKEWHLDLQAQPRGRLVYLRRTSEKGSVFMLGRTLEVDKKWQHRLVRCEVDLETERIRFYTLRRRDPHKQPCLGETPYKLLNKPFHE